MKSTVSSFLALACLALAACTTQSESMQVHSTRPMAAPAGSVCVQVGDGAEDTAIMEVSDTELREAIEASVTSAGLFSPVLAEPAGADYLLYAVLVLKNQALVSLSSETETEVYWRLIDQRARRVLWSESITTLEGGGAAGLIGNNRTAGSASALRQNISQALDAMRGLGLTPDASPSTR